MLVLTRREGGVVVIIPPGGGDPIEITVTEIRGEQVRIGVTAPRALAVHRAEVYDQVQAEDRAAARSASAPDIRR